LYSTKSLFVGLGWESRLETVKIVQDLGVCKGKYLVANLGL
jgi:hypothetical protein